MKRHLIPAAEQLYVTLEPTGTGAFVMAVSPVETGMIKQLETLQVGQLATVSYVAPNLQRTLNVFVLFPVDKKNCSRFNFFRQLFFKDVYSSPQIK